MLSRPVRLTLIVALLGYGLFRLLSGVGSGWLYIAAAGAFSVGLLKHGSVSLAYQAVVAGDLAQAAQLLAQVKDPAQLTRQDRAYFHWVSGRLAAAAGQHREAYQHFATAASGGLRTPHIRAATECALAEAAIGLGDLALAKSHLTTAQSIPSRDELKPIIAALAARVGSA